MDGNSTSPLASSVKQLPKRTMVKPQPLTSDLSNRLRSLYPINWITLAGTYGYHGCWHVVSRPFPVRYRQCILSTHTSFFLHRASLRSKPSSLTRLFPRSDFRPLAEDYCQFLQSLGRNLSPSVAGSPFQVGYYGRLGEPLPPTINTTQVHLVVGVIAPFK